MTRLTKISTASLVAATLGLGLAACQAPQELASTAQEPAASEAAAPKSTDSTATMTVAEVQETVVGNTVFVRDEAKKVSRAQYFSPDGIAKLRAKPDGSGMVSDFDGTYRFDDQGKLCINYPTLPISRKEFCTYMVLLGDGRYELTVGGIFERVLEGEQLDKLN